MECSTENWRTVIEVAMHFNEMLVSTRSLVASVMTAVFGAAAISTIHLDREVARVARIPIGVLILSGGLMFLTCMFFLDHLYYYQLLLGAVDVAENMERRCSGLPSLTLELSKIVTRDAALRISVLFYAVIALAMLFLGIGICIWDRKRKSCQGGDLLRPTSS